jgi:predicted metal-dependent peptidase
MEATMNTEMHKKMVRARAGLVMDQPFFASLALRLALKEDPTCETAWTDGKSIGYNPKFVEELSLDELKGVYCHEVMHLAAGHQARRGERNKQDWNKAGDYAINQAIIDCKMVLPRGALVNVKFQGKSSEAIYTALGGGKKQDGNQPGPNGLNGPQGPGAPSQGDPGDADKPGQADPGNCGEVRDSPGEDGHDASPAEKQESEREWKVATQQAAQQAKTMGSLPGALKRLIDEWSAPKVDWREVLRRFVEQAAKADYSWTRPNTRYLGTGFILPSLYSEELPPIVIAIDTSGSIDKDVLNQFASELSGIIGDHVSTAYIVYCDEEITGSIVVGKGDLPLTLEPIGGGGTDFRPVMEWVERENITPACMIYLTDMYCRHIPEDPGYPVLWAVWGGNKDRAARYGEYIDID